MIVSPEFCLKSDLENDIAEIFGVTQNLDCSLSGHYLIPLNDHDANINICLVVNNENENHFNKTSIKLPREFAHPPLSKFTKLQNVEN